MESKNMTRNERLVKLRKERWLRQQEEKRVFLESIKKEFEELENHICMVLDLDLKIFKSKCHSRNYSDARAMLFAIMRPLTQCMIGLKLLAKLHRIGYNHSSVIHCLHKHEHLVKNDQEYKQMFELIR